MTTPDQVYEAGPLKRRRRTKAQIAQLDAQIIDVLREDHPQSVRHVFYRMTDPRLPEPVEKSDRGYEAVQRRAVELRRNGSIPYGWITDATRRGYFVDTFSDAGEFLSRVHGLYRADLWQGCPVRCEVWVESRSIAGVVQRDCAELAVPLYPTGGFSSISLAHEAAELINTTHDGQDLVIFYIGDHDPAGVLIDVVLERELREHLDPGIRFTFERLAINPDQIARYGLPSRPRKARERRAPEVTEAVEAEAMPAGLLRGLLRDRIEALLPPDALHVARVAEESEKAYLRRIADILSGGDAS